MTKTALLDSGPLVALLDRRDQHHVWALSQMAQLRPPLRTCESVLAEAFHLLRPLPQARGAILEMISEGLLKIPFQLSDHTEALLALIKRYANVPMSLADACLVRMSETFPRSSVFTLDSDFHIYRRHGRQTIPVLMPPGKA